MHIHIVTIFPNFFDNFVSISFVKRAIEIGVLKIDVFDLRNFGVGKHKRVDDEPFGGGCGMLMMVEPLVRSIEFLKEKILSENRNSRVRVILLSPQGVMYSQKMAIGYAKDFDDLILLCGRYEGFDERVLEFIDDEVSIGNFVLSGGEVPAMVIVESIVRFLPNVIGSTFSYKEDSFYNDLTLDFPQYTRPRIFRNYEVPGVLLSGDHKAIKAWREKNRILNTKKKRLDLLKNN